MPCIAAIFSKRDNCSDFLVASIDNIVLPKLGLSLTHCILVDSSHLYIGQVHLSFKGHQVYFVALILFLMENPVSKHCRP